MQMVIAIVHSLDATQFIDRLADRKNYNLIKK